MASARSVLGGVGQDGASGNIGRSFCDALYSNDGVIVFDLETTGLRVDRAEIVEIAACRMQATEVGRMFQVYALPRGEIPPAASRVNGLTIEDGQLYLKGRRVPSVSLRQALESFVAWIESNCENSPILLAHNCLRYDSQVLLNNLERASASTLSRFEAMSPMFGDSLPLFKAAFPDLRRAGGYSLPAVYEATFGRRFENGHQAETDVARLTELLLHQAVLEADFAPCTLCLKCCATSRS